MKKSLLYTLCLICMAGASGCGDADYWAIYGECEPQCDGKNCGDDGCGGVCGTCNNGLICNEKTNNCVECIDDATRCAEEQKLQTCVDGKWGEAVVCEAGVCFEDACCQPKCDGKTCGDNGCGGECKCGDNLICNAESGECKPECADGEKRCFSEDVAQICQNGKWQDQPCKRYGVIDEHEYCDTDKCAIRACQSSLDICRDGNIAVRCKENEMPIIEYCGETSTVCSAGNCVTHCTVSETTCAGKDLLKCEEGKEPIVENCEEGFECKSGKCVCSKAFSKCEGNTSIICIPGKELQREECDDEVCESGVCFEKPVNMSCGETSESGNFIRDFNKLYKNCMLVENHTIKDKKVCVENNVLLEIDEELFYSCNLDNVEIIGSSEQQLHTISIDNNLMGSLFGKIENKSKLSNLVFKFDVGSEGKPSKAQGLLAASMTDTTLDNLNFDGDLNTSATTKVGGVVGDASNSTISNVHYNGKINVTAKKVSGVGGITGSAVDTTIENSLTEKGSTMVVNGSNIGCTHNEHNSNSSPECSSVSKCGGISGAFTHGMMKDVQNNMTITINANVTDKGMVDRIGGVVGAFFLSGGDKGGRFNILTNVGNIIISSDKAEYVGGVIGKAAGYNHELNELKNNLEHEDGGKISFQKKSSVQYLGGVFGEVAGMSVDNIQNICDKCEYGQNVDPETSKYTGGIAGNIINHGELSAKLTNVTNKISSVTGNSYVGGFAGFVQSSTIGDDAQPISNTVTSVKGQSKVGGFAGFIDSSTLKNIENKITDINNGSVVNEEYVGGFAGSIQSSTIGDAKTTISNTVTSVKGHTQVGGFAGIIYSSEITNIENTINDSVTGTSKVGGFAGSIEPEPNATDPKENKLNKITNQITKSVTGERYTGGFIGVATGSHDITNVENIVTNVLQNDSTEKQHLGGFVSYIYSIDADRVSNYKNIKNYISNLIAAKGTAAVGGFVGQIEGVDKHDPNVNGLPANKGDMEIVLKQIDSRTKVDLKSVDKEIKYVSYGGFIGYYHNDKFQLNIENVFSHAVVENVEQKILYSNKGNGIGGYIGKIGNSGNKKISINKTVSVGKLSVDNNRAVFGQKYDDIKNIVDVNMYFYGKNDWNAFSNGHADIQGKVMKLKADNDNIKNDLLNKLNGPGDNNALWDGEDISPLWDNTKQIWTPVVQITDWAAATTSN